MPSDNPALQVLIAAGGTGGHLLPAKQLAEILKKSPECLPPIFMGNGFKKASYWTDAGFSVFEVPSSSVRKKSPWGLLKASFFLALGTFKSLRVLRQKKVDVVVGFGSYHSFPVLLAAKCLRIPTVLFEANCILGRVNGFFAKKCKALALQFPIPNQSSYPSEWVETLPWVKPDIILKKIARKELGLDANLPTFLLFGGSQGASFLNQLFGEVAQEWVNRKKNFQIIHLTGTVTASEEMESLYKKLQIPSYVRSFEKDMPKVFSASDLVICRSGASTLAELIFFEKPALLIPYPYAAENHQEENARFFVNEVKGGMYLLQKELTLPFFLETLEKMQQTENILQWTKQISQFKEMEKSKTKKDLVSLVLEAKPK